MTTSSTGGRRRVYVLIGGLAITDDDRDAAQANSHSCSSKEATR